MKKFLTMGIVGVGAAALVYGCEPGAGSCDGGNCDAKGGTGTGGTTAGTGGTTAGTGGTTAGTTAGTTGTADTWGAVELEDDSSNATLTGCDKGSAGSIRSPGADIDAVGIIDKANNATWASSCTAKGQTCTADQNDNADPSAATGAPNATGKEEDGGYMALGGGFMYCEFGGKSIERGQGQVLEIYEVGTQVEKYKIALCKSKDGNCQFQQGKAQGKSTVTVDLLQ